MKRNIPWSCPPQEEALQAFRTSSRHVLELNEDLAYQLRLADGAVRHSDRDTWPMMGSVMGPQAILNTTYTGAMESMDEVAPATRSARANCRSHIIDIDLAVVCLSIETPMVKRLSCLPSKQAAGVRLPFGVLVHVGRFLLCDALLAQCESLSNIPVPPRCLCFSKLYVIRYMNTTLLFALQSLYSSSIGSTPAFFHHDTGPNPCSAIEHYAQ